METTVPPANLSCDDSSMFRVAFISIGTSLAALGCVFNGILLYIFLRKTQRAYPFQTFLAFLDFMLCALYIHCFGLLSFSVEYEIAFLYNFVMESNVVTMVMSRIVQLAIPYTLIANSAEKLAMITGWDCESRYSLKLRIGVIAALLITASCLRINGLHTLFIGIDESCDYFHSKYLALKPEIMKEWSIFENVLTFFHTFVSFVVLCALNIIVVLKLRVQHRKTRRQSTSPAQLFSTTDARIHAAQEIRDQQHKLRCAVKTTVVIITAYLFCNCTNFVLYVLETFKRSWIEDENKSFRGFYVMISDIGSNLFVMSSTIRIFIYYKFNAEVNFRKLIKDIWIVKLIFRLRRRREIETLLTVEKTDV